jgi:hypothetical protein
MAVCFRDPSRKAGLKKRIEDYFSTLRNKVPRPDREDPKLVKKYGEYMGRLRTEEEIILEMLEAFSNGDVSSVRAASSRLARP